MSSIISHTRIAWFLRFAVSIAAAVLIAAAADARQIRIATFNTSLNRPAEGMLVRDLSSPDDSQAKAVAEIIQRVRPDVVLLNEFDYDADGRAVALFLENYLSVSRADGTDAIRYEYAFTAPSNTGIPSGFDLDNNGAVGGGNDAFGFGDFPGQYGMALLSNVPIDVAGVRTFQSFLWRDMPEALLPDDPNTPEPNDWYDGAELNVLRLSSKSHWDVPIDVGGIIVHVLAAHPTPPVFDGAEDRNGRRNHDEIRFWSDYVDPSRGQYIVDDNGRAGGLEADARFVIVGDYNADPLDGDSVDGAIRQLLDHPLINSALPPRSEGGAEAVSRQGRANQSHRGDPALDTADFADSSTGNLRVDYVLPSWNLDVANASVFWPTSTDPLFPLVGDFPFPSSDHRMVYVDVVIVPEPAASTSACLACFALSSFVVFLHSLDRLRFR